MKSNKLTRTYHVRNSSSGHSATRSYKFKPINFNDYLPSPISQSVTLWGF